jgi:hypothetical protein
MPKLYLICNPITCSDIVNTLISQRSYSTYFKETELNISKVPSDNYVSELGLVQINYLIKGILNSSKLDKIKDADLSIPTRVFTSISISSIETALRVYAAVSAISPKYRIEVCPYINNVVRNIDKKTLPIRNRKILQKINNSRLTEDIIQFNNSINYNDYMTVNISKFWLKMTTSLTRHLNSIVFCDYTFIRDFIKSITKDFGEDIEPTSIFEIDKNTKECKKIYPIYGTSSNYKMEGDFYTYSYNNKRLPLLPYWRSTGIQKRVIPYITEDVIKSCLGRDIIEKYIKKYPYNKNKKNIKNSKNTIISGIPISNNNSFHEMVVALTK